MAACTELPPVLVVLASQRVYSLTNWSGLFQTKTNPDSPPLWDLSSIFLQKPMQAGIATVIKASNSMPLETSEVSQTQQSLPLRKNSVNRVMPGDDINAAVCTLSSAFSSDPLLRYIYNVDAEEDITSRNKALFHAVLTYHLSRRDGCAVVHTDVDAGVVAVWQENGAWKAGNRDYLRLLPTFFKTFGFNSRAHSTANRLDAQHPQNRCHVHLQLFGSDAGRRGSEQSSKVIRRMLDRLDVNRMAAYVESANPDDIEFYELHGFKILRELSLRPGAPRVVGMWRDPHP